MTANLNNFQFLLEVKKCLKMSGDLIEYFPDLKTDLRFLKIAVSNGYSFEKLDNNLQRRNLFINSAFKAIINNRVPFFVDKINNPRLLIGDMKRNELLNKIEKAFKSICGKTISIVRPPEQGSPFLRDVGIVAPKNIFAIAQEDPTNWNEKRPAEYTGKDFYRCLPEYHQFLLNDHVPKDYQGKGGTREVVSFFTIFAHYSGIPYTLQHTLIEGGNCYLFSTKNRNYAIVGEFSLYLNYLKFKFSNAIPSGEEFIRQPSHIACLIAYRFHMKEIQDDLNWYSFVEFLKKPFQITNEIELLARKVEFQLNWVKERIAFTLGVSIENLIFVPQRKFHIDLEMTVTPEGEILLHDDNKVCDILESIQEKCKLTADENLMITDILVKTNEDLKLHNKLINITKKRLEKRGLTVKPAALSFHSNFFKFHLNYANGIFEETISQSTNRDGTKISVKTTTFFTTGPTFEIESKIHNKAIASLKENLNGMPIVCIEKLSNFVHETNGGIRCLTIQFN